MSTLDFDGSRIIDALEDQFSPAVALKSAKESVVKNAIICSFYTGDEYYKSHALRLQTNLEELGIAYELRQISKGKDEDWADICGEKSGSSLKFVQLIQIKKFSG